MANPETESTSTKPKAMPVAGVTNGGSSEENTSNCDISVVDGKLAVSSKGRECDVLKRYGIRFTSKMQPANKQCVIKLNYDLDETLRKMGAYETEAQRIHRQWVLKKLDILVSQWVTGVWKRRKNLPVNADVTVDKKLIVFGSCGMGVQCQGTDVDLLVVAPHFIPREEFFTSFITALRKEEVMRCLRAIPESYVPVIKLECDGVQLDMLYANVKSSPRFPSDQAILDDINIIPQDDIKSLRSLNGYRISEEIINQAPNVDAFRLALRAVKLWAKAKGIYSNILGFLGGVSYSILVARTCQMHPDDSGAVLVYKFFCMFANWDWSKPVMLCDVDCSHTIARGDISHWNPKGNERDRCQLMPIITPCLPPINSAYNVTKSSFIIMVDELKEAAVLTNEIITCKKPWSKLFHVENFYRKYNYFAVVTVKSYYDVELHAEWTGLVESKLRLFVCMLEECREISIAHINPTPYPPTPSCSAPSNTSPSLHMTRWSIGLSINVSGNNINLMTVANQFKSIVLGHLHRFSPHTHYGMGSYELDLNFCDGFGLQNFLPAKVILNIDESSVNGNSNARRLSHDESSSTGVSNHVFNGTTVDNVGSFVSGRRCHQSATDLVQWNGDCHSSDNKSAAFYANSCGTAMSSSGTPSLHSVRSWPDISSLGAGGSSPQTPVTDGSGQPIYHTIYVPDSVGGTTSYHPYFTTPIITNGYGHNYHQEAVNLLTAPPPEPPSPQSLHQRTDMEGRLSSLCLAGAGAAVPAPSHHYSGGAAVPAAGTGRRRRHVSHATHHPHHHQHRYDTSRSVPELRSPPQVNVRDRLPQHRSDIKINLKQPPTLPNTATGTASEGAPPTSSHSRARGQGHYRTAACHHSQCPTWNDTPHHDS